AAELEIENLGVVLRVLRPADIGHRASRRPEFRGGFHDPGFRRGQSARQMNHAPHTLAGNLPGLLDADCFDSGNHSHHPSWDLRSKTRATWAGPGRFLSLQA